MDHIDESNYIWGKNPVYEALANRTSRINKIYFKGKLTLKQVPFPWELVRRIVPCKSVMIFFAIPRPNPVPSWLWAKAGIR